jgi:hypothetical protein
MAGCNRGGGAVVFMTWIVFVSDLICIGYCMHVHREWLDFE